MIETIDHFFRAKAESDDDKRKRLRQAIDGYQIPPKRLPMLLRAYNDHTTHGVYPFAGGLLAQPMWVLSAFDYLYAVGELMRLEKKLPRADGLPTEEKLGL